jgi:mannose-6-phosphate isomerase-like protein (cupin superfamily)
MKLRTLRMRRRTDQESEYVFFTYRRQTSDTLRPDEGKVLDVLGEVLTIKVAGEDTDGAYTIIQEVSPPSGGPPLHLHHREDEAFYVLEGEYEVQYGDERISATPGTFIFAPREIPHTFRNVSAGRGKVLAIVTPAGIEKFFEELSEAAKQGPLDLGRVRGDSREI